MDEEPEDHALNDLEEQDAGDYGDYYNAEENNRASNTEGRHKAIPYIILMVLLILIGTGVIWNGIQEQTMLESLSRQQSTTQQQIAQTQQQEIILQAYMDKISDLMVHDKLLQAKAADPAKISADAYTHDALPRLDADHKAELMRFLYQTKLLSNDSNIIDLKDVDIHGAHMRKIDIRDTYLVGANLSGADLRNATLSDATLTFTNLSGANLSHADLHACDMHNTNLAGADLTGANLRDVIGLQDEQLAQVKSLAGATMPDGTVHK
jgi:uncharacterized protein YjbI with pentapeptide repeats